MTTPQVILLDIQTVDGWYKATTPDISDFIMYWHDDAELIADVPATIQAYYKAKFGEDVKVYSARSPEQTDYLPRRYVITECHA